MADLFHLHRIAAQSEFVVVIAFYVRYRLDPLEQPIRNEFVDAAENFFSNLFLFFNGTK